MYCTTYTVTSTRAARNLFVCSSSSGCEPFDDDRLKQLVERLVLETHVEKNQSRAVLLSRRIGEMLKQPYNVTIFVWNRGVGKHINEQPIVYDKGTDADAVVKGHALFIEPMYGSHVYRSLLKT